MARRVDSELLLVGSLPADSTGSVGAAATTPRPATWATSASP